MPLNHEQQAAVEHTGSPLVIYAGPGTGKTLVLQKKYEHLINQGIKPYNILGITFTRNAAKELSERIAESCKIREDLITTQTFHAFALSILRKYNNHAALMSGFQIADPDEQDQIIYQCLKEQTVPFTQNHIMLVKQIISRMKKKQQIIESESYIEEYARLIYPKYQALLNERKKIDYDDIIQKALITLETPAILEQYQEMYHYIMLDEAQDTTIPQSEIIYKMNCRDTTIVGDQNQAIYSFAGANPNFMKEFEQKTGSTVIHLRQNYRNPQGIINAANTVIQFNQNYIENELQAQKNEERKIAILHTLNETTEAQLITNSIEYNNLKNVTILYRRNESVKPIELALQKKRIPYQINGIHFNDRKEIQSIISALRLIADPEDRELFRKVILTNHGLGRQTVQKIFNEQEVTREPLTHCGKKKMTRMTHEQHMTLKLICGKIEEAKDKPLSEQIEIAIKHLTPVPKNHEQKENMETFKTIFDTTDKSIKQVLKYIEKTTKNPPVRLMTMHAAKGTENDIVFIIGTEEGLIPDENAFIDTKAIEEERRLFYVGLTRCRETLVLSHSQSRLINGKRLTQQPSRFLNEIPEKEFL